MNRIQDKVINHTEYLFNGGNQHVVKKNEEPEPIGVSFVIRGIGYMIGFFCMIVFLSSFTSTTDMKPVMGPSVTPDTRPSTQATGTAIPPMICDNPSSFKMSNEMKIYYCGKSSFTVMNGDMIDVIFEIKESSDFQGLTLESFNPKTWTVYNAPNTHFMNPELIYDLIKAEI